MLMLWWVARETHLKAAGLPITIGAGCLIGGALGCIIWFIITPNSPTLPTLQTIPPPTLHSMFLLDFNNSFGFNFAPRNLERAGGDPIPIEARLLIDLNSASKFVSFYLADSQSAYEACTFMAGDYEELGGLKLFHMQVQGPAGPIFTDKFKFTGRVFIYHEDLFTPEQSGELHKLYQGRNLILELRGQEYLQFETLRRKEEARPISQ